MMLFNRRRRGGGADFARPASPESSTPILTAEIHDAHPDEVAVCDVQFRSFGRRLAFAGPCATLKVHEDHRRAKELLAEPGDARVLVVDAGGSTRIGIMGDMMAEAAVRNGWAGAVIYGVIRDSAAIDALDIGVKALGTTARRSNVDMGGVVGATVAFGGVTFEPGAWVYADRDAVIVSRRRLPGVEL